MKNKTIQKAPNLFLIIIAMISLCSCGRNTEKTQDENSVLAKEHVYRFQEIALPETGGDETDIYASTYRQQKVFLLAKVTDWKDYNDNDMQIISFRDDGSDVSAVPLETIPWKPGEDVSNRALGYSSYDNYTFGADGQIYAIRTYYREDAENEKDQPMRYLCCWAEDGSLLRETELGESFVNQAVNAVSVTPEGMASLILTDDHAWKVSVDARGNLCGSSELSEEIFQAFSGSVATIAQPAGKLLLVRYDGESYENYSLTAYDPASDSLGEVCRMPSVRGWDGLGAIAADGKRLLYSNRAGICSCFPGDAEGTEKMNFINSDIFVSSFDALTALSENSFAGVFREGYGSETKAGIFTYTDPTDIPDKTVLVLAGTYISDKVMQRVVEFNRDNIRYRITVKNIEEYDSDEELAAGIVEMTNSIFSGDTPDILIMDGLPAEAYAARGLLADIGELIQKDDELSRTDFLQNVFDAYSADSKLYYVIPGFEVGTMIGASSTVGDRTSWTFTDAAQLLEALPEGTSLLPAATRDSFLATMMVYCGGSFIDTSSGTCNFLSQDFLKMAEYAKALPEELDADYYGEAYWRNFETQYREGRTVLAGMPISGFSDINYYVNGIFGEEVSYIGFPGADGSGSYIRAVEQYAISSRSHCPEGAWEFLRYYLTDEYQSSLDTGLPVQKKYLLDHPLPESMTEEQMDKLVAFILSVDRRYYENEEIMNIITEEMGGFFSGDKTAQEAAKIIQNRVQLYIDTNMK